MEVLPHTTKLVLLEHICAPLAAYYAHPLSFARDKIAPTLHSWYWKSHTPLIQVSLELCELSVHDGPARGADDGVVGEHDELDVKQAAGANPAHAHSKPGAEVPVEARLRSVCLGVACVGGCGWVGRCE